MNRPDQRQRTTPGRADTDPSSLAIARFMRDHHIAMRQLRAMCALLEAEFDDVLRRAERRGPKLPAAMHLVVEQAPLVLSAATRRLEHAAHELTQALEKGDFSVPTGPGARLHQLPVEPVRFTYKVLIADDDPLSRQTLATMVGERGYSVTVVENGEEALQACRNGSFDLILMDCRMPHTDGFQASVGIMLERPQQQIPAIVGITHTRPEEYLPLAKGTGMLELCEKPISATKLDELLARYSPRTT
ncbi:MAG: response regulator [Gammaproteobacteria bacterium]